MRFELTMVLALAALSGCSSASEVTEGLAQGNSVRKTADNCLAGQDLNAPDVDISSCPPLPEYPQDVRANGDSVSLGAWEIGTTATGATYKYGSLATSSTGTRVLEYSDGSAEVNAENVACWAKGYYRLRQILQNPPREWTALSDAGFQGRFFQFQTDLRNGRTGYRKISSYMDHLVKWVTVVDASGVCEQPTLKAFRDYAADELTRRGLPLPAAEDTGETPDGSAADAGLASDGGADAEFAADGGTATDVDASL